MLKAARLNAQSPLHRVLRALVTGMREAPDENDGANQAAAQQMLLVPWAMTQLTHKLHVPSKRGGLQSRCSEALYSGTEEGREILFHKLLGLCGAKAAWTRGMDAALASIERLQFLRDSLAFLVFDNLGWKRQGGAGKSKRLETVAATWKEITWDEIEKICLADAHNDAAWRPKDRSALSVCSFAPSETIYAFLSQRFGEELSEAVHLEQKIAADRVQNINRTYTCRNEFYDAEGPRSAVSTDYVSHRIEELNQEQAEGGQHTLMTRNNAQAGDMVEGNLQEWKVLEFVMKTANDRLAGWVAQPAPVAEVP